MKVLQMNGDGRILSLGGRLIKVRGGGRRP